MSRAEVGIPDTPLHTATDYKPSWFKVALGNTPNAFPAIEGIETDR
jgi:hypothetical protein